MKNNYQLINDQDLSLFESIVGEAMVLLSVEAKENYGHDETEDLVFHPDVVLKPNTTDQIASILKHCNERNIPVTTRAGGTGLSGGALPIYGGVLLSMERFNQLIEIDERNLQATVEPGMITQVFMDLVNEKGLMYPVDPSSKGSSMLGGNLAESSGGPRAVKYGTVRDYVLNMEIVLPNGEIIWTGSNTLKYSSGYNLTHLMIGSEGTLAIITKIVFKLIPQPKHNLLLLASFPTEELACDAVSAIFRDGNNPSAVEFIEKEAVDWVVKYEHLTIQINPQAKAFLLIEVDGNDLDLLMNDCEKISNVLMNYQAEDILFADSAQQKEDFWRMRRSIALSVKANSIYKEEDTVVPRAELAKLLKGVKAIGLKYGFQSVCYGHAGDGNLHVNILKNNLSDEQWNIEIPKAITEIFEHCKQVGGTISGEHGIGLVKKDYLPIVFGETHFTLMHGIKNTFDPNHILNPGKWLN